MAYKHIKIPKDGAQITFNDAGELNVPPNRIIPFIEGDGIGPDIWKASVNVFDSAVRHAYGNNKKIDLKK